MLMMNIVNYKPGKSGRSTSTETWNAISHGLCVVDWYVILDGMLSLLPSIVTLLAGYQEQAYH